VRIARRSVELSRLDRSVLDRVLSRIHATRRRERRIGADCTHFGAHVHRIVAGRRTWKRDVTRRDEAEELRRRELLPGVVQSGIRDSWIVSGRRLAVG
jgi:hypothetical protein